MSLLHSIKSTLQDDLKIVESDADEIAVAMVNAGKQTFSAILESVLQKAKSRPIGEILEGVFEIYKNLHADADPPAAAPPPPSS